jgi:hypothetical protein
MKLGMLVVLVALMAVVAGWGTLRHGSAGVVFAQDRDLPLLVPQGAATRAPIAEPAPIDPSVPAVEARLIRDLQLRVALLERQVRDLQSSKAHFSPLSGTSK